MHNGQKVEGVAACHHSLSFSFFFCADMQHSHCESDFELDDIRLLPLSTLCLLSQGDISSGKLLNQRRRVKILRGHQGGSLGVAPGGTLAHMQGKEPRVMVMWVSPTCTGRDIGS